VVSVWCLPPLSFLIFLILKYNLLFIWIVHQAFFILDRIHMCKSISKWEILMVCNYIIFTKLPSLLFGFKLSNMWKD
jgi:hypothetical protein